MVGYSFYGFFHNLQIVGYIRSFVRFGSIPHLIIFY